MAIAVALAVIDFAGVFFLSLALFFLAQLVARLDRPSRVMALVGLGLVTASGLAGAGSNLSLAISQREIPLLATTFYVFGAPGFTLMAAAMVRANAATRERPAKRDPWLAPTVISWSFLLAAFYLQSSRPDAAWSVTLLFLGLSAGAVTCFVAASLGWRRRLHMAAGLLVFEVVGTLTVVFVGSLGPLHVLIDLSLELLKVAAQAAFAFAAWRIAAEYQAKVGPSASG